MKRRTFIGLFAKGAAGMAAAPLVSNAQGKPKRVIDHRYGRTKVTHEPICFSASFSPTTKRLDELEGNEEELSFGYDDYDEW